MASNTDDVNAQPAAAIVPTAIRNLHTRCHNSMLGYRRVAENVADDYLAGEFEELSDERRVMAEALDECLRSMGEATARGATAAARTRRLRWDFGVIAHDSDRAHILCEVLKGESAMEQAYDDALKTELPSAVREAVARQHRSVRRVRNRFQELLKLSEPQVGLREREQVPRTFWYHPLFAAATGIAIAGIVWGLILNRANTRRGFRR